MTRLPTPSLPLAAVALAALGLGCTSLAADSPEVDAPVACAISIERAGSLSTVVATVTATEAVAGDFDLSVESRAGGNRSVIRQGGAFALAAGETETLGRATLSGDIDAKLDLTVKGRRMTCPTAGPIDL